MKNKINIAAMILLVVVSANLTFGGSLPLNTGYDYSNSTIYSFGSSDDYWIRIASYPVMSPAVGPAWAVSTSGTSWLTLPNSTWINPFGSTNVTPNGYNAQNPAYALYRKCFCLRPGYNEPRIQASVRSDESIQIWLNLMGNQVLTTSPINLNGTPYAINYTNASAFRVGKNCLYVLVEDTGVHTGFNLDGKIFANNVTPLIAKGANMSFEPCSCSQGPQPAALQKRLDAEDEQVVKEIVKVAEMKRIERIRRPDPRN